MKNTPILLHIFPLQHRSGFSTFVGRSKKQCLVIAANNKNYPHFTCKPCTVDQNDKQCMIRIEYYGGNDRICVATNHVNKLFNNIPFLDAIYNFKKFDMATVSPKEITEMFCNTELRLTVDLYWPLKFSSTAHAYDDSLSPDVIKLNKLTLNRPVHGICNTLVHQCVHALNSQYPAQYFGHGNNDPNGKENTAPYRIAELAQKMIAKNEKTVEPMQHEEPGNIHPFKHGSSKQIQETLFHEGIFCIYDMMVILEAN